MVGERALFSGEAASPDGEIARAFEPIDDGGFRSGRHRATNPTVKARALQRPSLGNEQPRPSFPSRAR
jgi:hypothetical protein